MATGYIVIDESDAGTFQRKLSETSGRVIASNAYRDGYNTRYYALVQLGNLDSFYIQEMANDLAQIRLSASDISVNTKKYY